jgi:hypothetical protein
MEKKELVKEIKNLRSMKEAWKAYDANCMKLHRDWMIDNERQLTAAVKKDLDMPNLDVRVSLTYMYDNQSNRHWGAEVTGYIAHQMFNFTVDRNNISKVRCDSIGTSSSERAPTISEQLRNISKFCTTFGEITNKLISGLPETNALLATFSPNAEPELPEWDGPLSIQSINKMLEDMERELALQDYEVGTEIELYIPGKTRWVRNHWAKGKILSITPHSIMVEAEGWKFRIAKNDIERRLRLITE